VQQHEGSVHCTEGVILLILLVNALLLVLAYLTSMNSCLQACIGSKSCRIGVSIDKFGDPCEGVTKSLAVEASCA
jgi:hypothetical protein